MRPEEIDGVHFWLLKNEDQKRTHPLLFWFIRASAWSLKDEGGEN
jgi:hypothetical protein